MKSLPVWLAEYSQSHQNPLNKVIHKVCVPLIYFSIVSLITSMPWQVASIKFSELIIFVVMMRYLAFGFRSFFVMTFFTTLCMAVAHNWRIKAGVEAAVIFSLAIFVLAWVGQFVGHKIEGKKPSFLQDLGFLFVGPLWVFIKFIRR